MLPDPPTGAGLEFGACPRLRSATFRNELGQTISLRLLEIVDVAEVLDDDLTTTADLYCRHFTDIASYRAFEPMLDGEL